MSQLYTSSRLRVLRACLRLHYYRYTLGIQTAAGDAARFGTVGHAALEAWLLAWQAGDIEGRLPAALAAIDASDLGAYDKARLRALIVAYDTRWGGEEWEILAVEVEFRYELGEHLIGGKCDAIIRDRRDGRVYVLEHKLTGQDASPGGAYWQRLAIDTQVSIYVDGATMLGYEIAGVIYDVLQRPRHEPKLATPVADRKYTVGKGCKLCGGNLQGKQGTGAVGDRTCAACKGTGWRHDENGKPEAPRLYSNQRDTDESVDAFAERIVDEIASNVDAYLIRGVVVRLEDELPKMRNDLLDAIRLERAAALFDVHPRNPDACERYGALCPMFAACAGQADIADETRFPRGAAHPELATAA
jgi:hypothetical protein